MPTGSHQKQKTHCPQGHPYAGDNVRLTAGGSRQCRTCDRIRTKARRDAGLVTYSEDPRRRRDWHLQRKYGITVAQFESMAEAQSYLCAICKQPETLVLDHCHKTGAVRALLCQRCNKVLGLVGEDLAVLRVMVEFCS